MARAAADAKVDGKEIILARVVEEEDGCIKE